MEIRARENRISFGSLNSPVKNFRIMTTRGKLHVQEVRLKEKSHEFAFKISKFFNDNFVEVSTDPQWKEFLKPENKLQYYGQNQRYANSLKNLFKHDDGNTTVLLARDGNNNIKAGIISSTFRETPALSDSQLFYIDALAVDKDFRGENIGKRLLDKVLDSARKTGTQKNNKSLFTDAVLAGYENAVPFYEKAGFRELSCDTYKKALFYKELKKVRDDIPKYARLMYLPLDETAKRFYDRITLAKVSICNYKCVCKEVLNTLSDLFLEPFNKFFNCFFHKLF